MRRAVDIHQHLWPDALLSSLARRTVAPRLKRTGAAGGSSWRVIRRRRSTRPRTTRARGRATGSWSRRRSRSGSRRCRTPRRCSRTTTAACWSWARRSSCGRARRARRSWTSSWRRARSGIALAGRELVDERSAPALERLAAAGKPLFVHPGPAAGSPAWFPALTGYVAEMHAAWHAWAQWGRPRAPEAARGLRHARRARAAARRAARGARRAERGRPRPADVLRHLLLRPAGDRRDAARRRRGPAASTGRTCPVVEPRRSVGAGRRGRCMP